MPVASICDVTPDTPSPVKRILIDESHDTEECVCLCRVGGDLLLTRADRPVTHRIICPWTDGPMIFYIHYWKWKLHLIRVYSLSFRTTSIGSVRLALENTCKSQNIRIKRKIVILFILSLSKEEIEINPYVRRDDCIGHVNLVLFAYEKVSAFAY